MNNFKQKIILFIFNFLILLHHLTNRVLFLLIGKIVSIYLATIYGKKISFKRYFWLPSEQGKRWQEKPQQSHKLSIVVVTYKQHIALDCLLTSLRCQTLQNFNVIVLHDGPDDATRKVMLPYEQAENSQYRYIETETRFNDYGHTLREIGIAEADGEFILVTNGDNYFTPRLLEFAFDVLDSEKFDVLMWDIVHSHSNPGNRKLSAYNPFLILPVFRSIDIAAFMVRTEMAKKVGFRDKTHDGDASYLEDILKLPTDCCRIAKIEKTLLVHN